MTGKMYILNSDLQSLSWLPFLMMTRRLLNCSTLAGSQRNAHDPVVVSEKPPTEGHQLAELHHTLEITLCIHLECLFLNMVTTVHQNQTAKSKIKTTTTQKLQKNKREKHFKNYNYMSRHQGKSYPWTKKRTLFLKRSIRRKKKLIK